MPNRTTPRRRRAAARIELDHVVLESADPRRALEFYCSLLRLAPVREAEYLAGDVPFPSARIGAGSVIDFFPRSMWRGRRKENPNHICLSYGRAAFSALRRRLRARGIRIVRESRRNFGARGYGRSVYIRDPDGVTVEARCYPPSRTSQATR